MWKWRIITDEVSQDIRAAAAFASAFGLEGLEIRSVGDHDVYHLTVADVRAIRNAAQEHGLTVCAVAPPFFKCALDDDRAVMAHLDGLRRSVAAANELGAGIMRGFGFWRAENAVGIPFGRIAERFSQALPILEDGNVRMALENDPSVYTPNGRTLAALAEALNSPRIGVVWDPGNVIFDDAGEAPYPDGYAAVKGRILHMHLKDARRIHDKPEAVAFGTGAVDYKGQFEALLRDGYSGWMSLETHYRLDRALSEAALRLPAGCDFSQGGAAAGADFLVHMADKLRQWGMEKLYALPNHTK